MFQEDKIKEIKNAVEYFPYLFDHGHHLIRDNINDVKFDLDYEYNRYEENHFSSFYIPSPRSECVKREKAINRGYAYIKGLIEDRENTDIGNMLSHVGVLLLQYYTLTDEIGRYEFVPHHDSSFGANQNRANDEILYDLALFEDLVKDMTIKIDKYCKEHNDEYKKDIDERLCDLGENNSDSRKKLEAARIKYHNVWNGACRGNKYNYKELGKAKLEYRKTKNEACKQVLDYVKELYSISSAIDVLTYDTKKDPVLAYNDVMKSIKFNRDYNEAIKNIIHGPNYYAYLDKDEIERQSKLNKELKKQLKKNN